MNSLSGHLLVSIPDLVDPNFHRSVVLILAHQASGASGVILNRPSNVTVADAWAEFSDIDVDCDQPVYVGGPVEGPLVALHTSLAWAETDVLPGVFVTTDRGHLNQLIQQTKHPFRIFSGYAGWAGGQLEREIADGGWLTHPAEFEHIFESTEDELWKTLLEEMGNQIIMPHFLKHRKPVDPNLN